MEVKENKLIRVAGYGRVSTDSMDQKNSLEHQKTCFERDYKNNPKYIYNEEYLYFDRGISGTKLRREQFDRMLKDAGLDIIEVRNNDNDNRKMYLDYVTIPSSTRKPKFDLIIVRNTSRMARNINVVKILEQLKQLKVFVYFCDIDKTTKVDTDMEEIQSHLLAAERESRIKSRMVKFGTNEGALAGVIRASKRLYGYRYIKGDTPIESRLEIIESEAKVIRQIYKWYIEGYGIRRIEKLLTENKIFTRKDKPFYTTTLKGILTNEKYKGWSVRNKYDTGTVFNKNTCAKIRDQKEWIIDKSMDKVPAIVSEEDFDKVQEILNSKKEHVLNKGRYFGVSEFATKIICGKCGGVYYANRDGDRRFYNCSVKKRYGTDKCNNINITLAQIDERISPKYYIRDICEANLYFSQLLRIIEHKLINSYDKGASEKINELQNELSKLDNIKKRVVDIYTRGDIEEEDYIERITPLNERIKYLNLEISQLSKNNDDVMNDLKEVHETIAILRNDFYTYIDQSGKIVKKELARDYIVKDIKKIIVQENGIMNIEYKSYEKYFKLVEKHRCLLDIFLPESNYDKAKEIINSRINMVKEDILVQLESKKNMDIKK
ncbi:site-specific recombinase resolvase family putative [Clostridium sp. CAG:798]|nr:site-specific recombinase resolvase family putative [Clostridium sp. CAG:798]